MRAAWNDLWLVLKPIGEFALVIFAGVQLWVTRRRERDRQRAAYTALHAEYWRVRALSLDWEGCDLISLARQGLLYPEQLALRDWAAIARMMGEVSCSTAALGGYAYTQLNKAHTLARMLADGVPRGQRSNVSLKLSASCKGCLRDAAEELETALKNAPSHLRSHEFAIDGLDSSWGRSIQLGLLKATGRTETRMEPRLGIVGRIAGSVLARAARWLNPAAGWALESELAEVREHAHDR
jgi:hypothetical protein